MSFGQNYMNVCFAINQLLSIALKPQYCYVLLPSYNNILFSTFSSSIYQILIFKGIGENCLSKLLKHVSYSKMI